MLPGKSLAKFGLIFFTVVLILYSLSGLTSNPRSRRSRHGSTKHLTDTIKNINLTEWSLPSFGLGGYDDEEEDQDLLAAQYQHKVPGTIRHPIYETKMLPDGTYPRVGKITMSYGGTNPVYERAIKTHQVQADRWGYPMLVCRQPLMDGIWTKIACIQSMVIDELLKPEGERLEWIFWCDADSIITNPNIPLEAFLPPDSFKNIHVLTASDWNGLNAGVFAMRVDPWSVEVLAVIMAYRVFYPDEHLRFEEQTALEEVLKEDKYRYNHVQVPQRWFNAYIGGELDSTMSPWQVRRGDMLVHFAGVGDKSKRMKFWLNRAEQRLPDWELELIQTSYPTEVEEFWTKQQRELDDEKGEIVKAITKMDKLCETVQKSKEKFDDRLTDKQKGKIDRAVETARKLSDEGTDHREIVESAIDALNKANNPLQELQDESRKAILTKAHGAIYEAEKIITRVDVEGLTKIDSSLGDVTKSLEEQCGKLRDALTKEEEDLDEISKISGEIIDATKDAMPKYQEVQDKADASSGKSKTKSSDSSDGSSSDAKTEGSDKSPETSTSSDSTQKPDKESKAADDEAKKAAEEKKKKANEIIAAKKKAEEEKKKGQTEAPKRDKKLDKWWAAQSYKHGGAIGA